ncbi:MAG TPA: Tn3 family transposase [Porticoccus sp.]|nr:Tn3 family transposase [Porticoccus sp.]
MCCSGACNKLRGCPRNPVETVEIDSIVDRYHKIYFVLLLGYFKVKPVVLNFTFSEVKDDFHFVAAELFPEKAFKPRNFPPRQRTRLYLKVVGLLGYSRFSDSAKLKLQSKAAQIAKLSIEPRYILDECIQFLSHNKITIPKYSTLQRVVIAAITATNLRIFDTINEHMPGSLSRYFSELFSDDSEFQLKHIRRSAKDFTPKEVRKELIGMSHIKPHIDNIDTLLITLGLSPHNIEYYASLVDYYTITKLRRFDKNTRILYLLCFLQVRFKTISEHIADAFVYHCRRLNENAKQYAKEESYLEWTKASANVGKASALLRLFIDKTLGDELSFGVVKQQALKLLNASEIDSVCLYLDDEKRALDYYQWKYYDQNKDLITETLRPLFLAMDFKASESTTALWEQISKSKIDITEYGECQRTDQRFIKPSQTPYLYVDGVIDRHRYEVLLYLRIKSKLNGHLFIQNTTKYSALEDDLISDKDWSQKDEFIKMSQLDKLQLPVSQLLGDIEQALKRKLDDVSERIRNGDNQSVIMRSRSGKTGWRLPNKGMGSVLNNPFFEKLKQVHVVDLLRFVDRETGYLNAFEHVRVPQAHNEATKNNLVATLIGNGTNYGLHRMAHISDRSYEDLRQIQANYVRLETLNQANDIISNAITKLPIFQHYNIQENELHASADGQKFECRINTFKTRFSSKYFGTNKGVSAITLVANHVPINARVIGANEHESHFIFDLLYNNTSEIKPNVLSTDTHGANQVNFALLDLFGYTFAPRYAKVSKVIDGLFTLSDEEKTPLLALKKPIKAGYIEKEWDIVQRIVISLQQKKTTQAALVRKLSTYSANHPLVQALTEYDRMIKSMYLLDYIDDASLRNYVQRALNRGEAYHQLRRAISSVNGNRFRGGSDGEIDLWNECARLLTNAIIYFNSLILSKLLDHFDSVSDEKKLEVVKQVSPVAWVNINLNGTYSFSFENALNMEDIISPITSE